MDHELVLENSSVPNAYTLQNNITYLKAVNLNIKLTQIY